MTHSFKFSRLFAALSLSALAGGAQAQEVEHPSLIISDTHSSVQDLCSYYGSYSREQTIRNEIVYRAFVKTNSDIYVFENRDDFSEELSQESLEGEIEYINGFMERNPELMSYFDRVFINSEFGEMEHWTGKINEISETIDQNPDDLDLYDARLLVNLLYGMKNMDEALKEQGANLTEFYGEQSVNYCGFDPQLNAEQMRSLLTTGKIPQQEPR